ncbi:MAG: hypothetical protein LUG95_01100 [Clostridiales bacterium]|nr:hypothetical protein [Clostridiales bacterium]
MKKFLKVLAFIIVAVAIILGYNYYSNYSLFDFEDLYVPSYQEEIQKQTDETQASFEKIYYNQLDDDEKKVYDKIYYALNEYDEKVRIRQNIENERIFEIFRFVLAENPEIFWSRGSCSIDSTGNLIFDYICTQSEIEYYKQAIEENTKDIISRANSCSSDYEKALLIFEYIVDTTEYDEEAANDLENNPFDSVIIGSLVNSKAVCTGYAKAYQYLLAQCSLDAETIYGTAETQGISQEHAWTLQYLDGNYYYTDATWGDTFESRDSGSYTSHAYFCITESEISKTHTADDNAVYPECMATQDNYFIKEELYFESYNKSKLRSAIKETVDLGEDFIELKFSDDTVYTEVVNDLIESEGIYYLLLELDPFETNIQNDSLSYSTDEEQNILTLFLTEAVN